MRFGIWRGVAPLCVLAACLAMSGPSARADLWPIKHTIPRETPAMDFRTGDVMMAPPIPYGEYVKDYPGAIHGAAGLAAGAAHSALGAAHGLLGKVCGLCGSSACGSCGGLGLLHGNACGGCGGDGCTRCDGHGRLLTMNGNGAGNGHAGHAHAMPASYNGGGGHTGLLGGLLGKHTGGSGVGTVSMGNHSMCGPGMPCASSQGVPSGQGSMPSGQFSMACGGCGGRGLLGNGSACGGCGGRGLLSGMACGGCGGRGLLGNGSACGNCGGHGLFGNGSACNGCGGTGHLGNGSKCGLCGGTGLCAGALGKAKHIAGTATGLGLGLLGKLTHKGEIEYFVGPGGPVPLTPGYVPYVVPTRSPRDYFAFPPFSEQSQP